MGRVARIAAEGLHARFAAEPGGTRHFRTERNQRHRIERLEHRKVDLATDASLGALRNRRLHPDDREQRTRIVSRLEARHFGRVLDVKRATKGAGHALDHEIVPGDM